MHASRLALPLSTRFSPSKRVFSSSSAIRGYDDTIQNLRIGPSTRVIYQGFTGRVSTSNAQQSIEYGTKIVGGTTPGKEGQHLGLPLLPSVQKAAEQLKQHPFFNGVDWNMIDQGRYSGAYLPLRQRSPSTEVSVSSPGETNVSSLLRQTSTHQYSHTNRNWSCSAVDRASVLQTL